MHIIMKNVHDEQHDVEYYRIKKDEFDYMITWDEKRMNEL